MVQALGFGFGACVEVRIFRAESEFPTIGFKASAAVLEM